MGLEHGWHGDAWQARQMVNDESEIFAASKPLPDLIDVKSLTRVEQPYRGYDSFNLSLLGDDCCFRSSNFRPKTNAAGKHSFLSMGKLVGDKIEGLRRIDHRGFNVPLWDRYNGMEDPKLIDWRGQRWCLFVRPSHSIDRIGMRMISLSGDESYALPDPLNRQFSKNWMPMVVDGRLIFLTDVDPLRVYEFDGKALRPIHVGQAKRHGFLVHGGSNMLMLDGSMTGVVHGRFEIDRGQWFYWHAMARLSESLDEIRIGRPFYFEDRQIEFCLSIDAGEGIRIPYSTDDATINILSTDQIGVLYE